MLDYGFVIKQSSAFKLVSRDIESGRISHAYLFVSQDENYLEKFCNEISKLLINENDLENFEKNNLRIEKHIHPDVKFFGFEKNIDAETTEIIVDEANYSPFESNKKVFILWNVGEMNEISQNKILKTIEEPPKNTYFILASNVTSKLLSTILSRVKQVKLDSLTVDQISNLLENSGISSDQAKICAACSGNNATHAERLATDSSFVDFFDKVVSCFFEINGSRDVLKFSSIFSAKTIDKNEFIDVFSIIARDILMIASNSNDLVVNKNIISKLKVTASMFSRDALIELINYCSECKKNLNFNVNNTAIVDSLLFKLAEVKVKCRR